MSEAGLTGVSSCWQSLPAQGRSCSTPGVISIREQGALDLIRFLLHLGHEVRIQVSGESMKPTLLGGETVQISSLGGQVPRIGEILFFCDRQGNPVIHRLIRRYSCQGVPFVQTKGDACPYCDESVPVTQVLGRVSHILPSSDISTVDIDGKGAKNLNVSFIRLKSLLIVGRFVFFYYLRKAGFILRQ